MLFFYLILFVGRNWEWGTVLTRVSLECSNNVGIGAYQPVQENIKENEIRVQADDKYGIDLPQS